MTETATVQMLFIGGSAHGKILRVDDGWNVWAVSKSNGFTYEKELYEKQCCVFPDERNRRDYFFRWVGMSQDLALEQYLKRRV